MPCYYQVKADEAVALEKGKLTAAMAKYGALEEKNSTLSAELADTVEKGKVISIQGNHMRE